MDYSLDGHGLSREQLQAKAEAAAMTGQLDGDSGNRRATNHKAPKQGDACDWQGDAHEPELDDLAEACEKNQQPSGPSDTCDWRGDGPEKHDDDLARVCESDNKPKKSSRRDKPVDEADAIQMPIPRLPKVAELPEILFPSADDESPPKKQEPKSSLEPPARNGKQSDRGKGPKQKKAHAGNAAGPSNAPPKDRGAEDESPSEDKTHSPWVDSLEKMPATVIEKVNMGIKQTLDAAARALTPSAQKEPQSPEPTIAEKTRGATGLAPSSAAPPPADFYVPSSSRHSTEQPREFPVHGGDKKQERERNRSEKKARHEAKRKARQEKNKERKEKRREVKERRRKEKEWTKTAKKGGELPTNILQGLRIAPGAKVQHNSNCDICTKSAASVTSKKRDPKCTTCIKAAQREHTNQYLKSSNINLASSPSLDDLVNSINNHLSKEKKADEGLAQHTLLHIQDLTTNGGQANLREHKCNEKGHSGHLGRHGLDGNRDSPPSTDGGRVTSTYRNSSLPTIQTPLEVDWWVRAVSSKEPASLPYPSISPRTVTPLPR
ncbi:hypothetical protein EKO27_g2488 [Xylaria grammica]|uniref:Uncharacterized protein n=1 Tax=Xylaria grammica TaxID=363999 RepID=A0A439DDW4_9PEZI|nr:hypothetical protein EKO27_g2488 [Xylaria grammica]